MASEPKPRALRTEDEVRELVNEADEIRGLGDVVSRVTKKLGISECGGCARRREKLNRIFPMGRKR